MKHELKIIEVSHRDNRYIIRFFRTAGLGEDRVTHYHMYETQRSLDIRRLNRLDYYTRNLLSAVNFVSLSVSFLAPFELPSREKFRMIPYWGTPEGDIPFSGGVK